MNGVVYVLGNILDMVPHPFDALGNKQKIRTCVDSLRVSDHKRPQLDQECGIDSVNLLVA
jgi:hypothetical protein